MSKSEISLRSKRISRKRRRQKVSSKGKKILLLMLIVSLFWLIAGRIHHGIINQLANTYTVDYGALQKELVINDAVILREEITVLAPHTGNLTLLLQEGERVASGAKVAWIKAGAVELGSKSSIDLTAPQAGLICFHTDGLETVLKPAFAENLNLDQYQIPTGGLLEAADQSTVEKGQRVFKVVNNLKPFLLNFQVDTEQLQLFPEPGGKIEVRLQNRPQFLSTRVLKTISRGVAGQVILEVDHGDQLLHERQLKIVLILESFKGLMIPTGSIVYQEENPGVYKNVAQGFRWVPITILHQDQEYSIIEGLSRGEEIIGNPQVISQKVILNK